MIAVPLLVQGKPIGVLRVSADTEGFFHESDKRLVETLARATAVAVENARLSDQVRRHTEELEARYQALRTLQEIMSLVLASPDARHTVDLILDRAIAVGRFDMGRMYLVRGSKPEIVAERGLRGPGYISPYGRGDADGGHQAMIHVMSSQEPLLIDDVMTFDGLRGFKVEGIRSAVVVPVHAGADVLGVMALGTRAPRQFSATTVELVSAIGRQVGVAIQKAQLYEETQQAEERYRVVSEMTSDYAFAAEIDDDGQNHTLWITSAVFNVTGYTPEEIVAAGGARFFMHPDDRAVHEVRRADLRAGKPNTMETRVITKSGEIRWLRVITHPRWDEAKGRVVRYYAAAKDITAEKQAEEALKESEQRLQESRKMEAVGMLAGGIAHDFNNLLTVILGFSDLLVTQPEQADRAHYAEEIRKAAEQAASLTAQLLAFSRRQVLQPKVLNLNAVVSDMETMLRRIIGEDVELITRLDPRLGLVRADPSQLGQVIMNLAANARDAMPDGGQLIIETSHVDLDESYVERHGLPRAGKHVLLAISDTGVGMSADVRAHLFEPFFTTKRMGQGTGLGLAMVYGIVKQSDGDIWVYSEPGVGTTFKIYLPLLADATTEPTVAPEGTSDGSGTETVLVVEDEPSVRALAVAVLASQGYHVLEASHGKDAIDLCSRHTGAIHLVLTDLIMPGMSGRQLADELAHLRPDARVLYMSGYTDDVAVRHGLVAPSFAYLQKPFSPTVLARKVRQVLDASG